jgi:hypothetical protein
MLETLEEGLMRLDFSPDKINEVTTKKIYQGRIADVLPAPKVEQEFPTVDFREVVYPRLKSKVLEAGPRDILYCLVHGLYRNRARLFRQNRAHDPQCPVPECQGAVQDREHIFCSCTRVVEAWLWIRRRLVQLLANTVGATAISNEEFILLQYPKDTTETETVWLIGNYLEVVDSFTVGKNRKLNLDQLRGTLRGRLQGMVSRAIVQPQIFNL